MNQNEVIDQREREHRLIYSMIVAGKSANFADKALTRLMDAAAAKYGIGHQELSPLELLHRVDRIGLLKTCLEESRTGNYRKLERGLREAYAMRIHIAKCHPDKLQSVHGIGPKTSRFFVVWTRPWAETAEFAVLDVHVLRWMNKLGHSVPKHTPQSLKEYKRIEKIFVDEAKKRGKLPRALDVEIWTAGAGRTQETALPK